MCIINKLISVIETMAVVQDVWRQQMDFEFDLAPASNEEDILL